MLIDLIPLVLGHLEQRILMTYLPFVADFVEEISSPRNHRILNSHTDDIVDYDAEPSLKAIIHGGYNLGRGLTFKGLVVAYMLRGHSDMSGLMQMQRWCGYRSENGGERILDLMKIYLTQEDRDLYHRMLSIEKKNRYLLGSYFTKKIVRRESLLLFWNKILKLH